MKPFGRPLPEKEQKEMEKQRELAFKRIARLKSMFYSKSSGWQDFFDLLGDYIEACRKRKARIRLDIADQATIDFVRMLDREIYILEFVRNIPMAYVDKVNNQVQLEKRRNAPGPQREKEGSAA